MRIWRINNPAVTWPTYGPKDKEREKEKGHHQQAATAISGLSWTYTAKQNCITGLQRSFCACKPFVCVCVSRREKWQEKAAERWRHEVLWPERKSRQDISVFVNHWGDIYYIMAAGSPSKPSSSLGSLKKKCCLWQSQVKKKLSHILGDVRLFQLK